MFSGLYNISYSFVTEANGDRINYQSVGIMVYKLHCYFCYEMFAFHISFLLVGKQMEAHGWPPLAVNVLNENSKWEILILLISSIFIPLWLRVFRVWSNGVLFIVLEFVVERVTRAQANTKLNACSENRRVSRSRHFRIKQTLAPFVHTRSNVLSVGRWSH